MSSESGGQREEGSFLYLCQSLRGKFPLESIMLLLIFSTSLLCCLQGRDRDKRLEYLSVSMSAKTQTNITFRIFREIWVAGLCIVQFSKIGQLNVADIWSYGQFELFIELLPLLLVTDRRCVVGGESGAKSVFYQYHALKLAWLGLDNKCPS